MMSELIYSDSQFDSSDDEEQADVFNSSQGDPIFLDYVMKKLQNLPIPSTISDDSIRLMASTLEPHVDVAFQIVLQQVLADTLYTNGAANEDDCAYNADSAEGPAGNDMVVLVAEKDFPRSRFLSDFDVLNSLGRGGFGAAFKCQHKLEKSFYAVKRVPLNDNRKLPMEVAALTRLKHPYIIRYYQAWIEKYVETKFTPPPSPGDDQLTEDTECLFIQMEYCSTELSAHDFGIGGGWKFFLQLLDALHYMHGKNICHCDLSSHNILVDAEGDPRIIDFGLAHFLDERVEDEKTLALVDVQEIEDLDASAKGDVYSLGMLVADIFSPPFQTDTERCEQQVCLIYKRLLPTSLNDEYDFIKQNLLSMTNEDPRTRPSTAELLAIFQSKR